MRVDTAFILILVVVGTIVTVWTFGPLVLYLLSHKKNVSAQLTERNILFLMRSMILSRKEAVARIKSEPFIARDKRVLGRRAYINKLNEKARKHPLVKAYLNDAEIEVMLHGTDIWRVHEFPTFDTRFCDFRIKEP